MRAFFQWWIVRALALLLAASAASAQDRVPFRQEELDQMLAPVALYPDSLLSQMLMASTYPLEVVQAARWSRANPGLNGQDAVRAAEHMDWDPSVKSLTAFPQVLSMMDEKLEWTERLGEAFLAQQADVMDTIQGLRRRAEAAGNLGPNERMRVARQGEVIVIDPPAPGVVFVPYYNPLVVYGAWWWPLYPPVYWAPPPYYVVAAHRPAFAWGSGIVISAGFFFGHFDWPHRHVKVVHVHHYTHQARPIHVHTHWTHNPVHRRGVPFRNAEVRQRFEQQRASNARRGEAARLRRWEDIRQDERRIAAPGPRQFTGGAAPNNGNPRALSPAQPGQPAARGNFADRRTEAPRTATLPESRGVQPENRGVQPLSRAQTERTSRVEQPVRPSFRAAPQSKHAARVPAPAPRVMPQPVQRAAPVAAQPPRAVNNPQRGNDGARGNSQPRERAADRGRGRRF